MNSRSLRNGIIGSIPLGTFYTTVIGSASGVEHLRAQAHEDWPYLAGILIGFAIQITLVSEHGTDVNSNTAKA